MTSQKPQDPAEAAGSAVPADGGVADLIGYGRLPWDQLRTLIRDSPAAWADYDGFHISPAPPDDPPPYSHLWAWTNRWLIRARIEGTTAITGALILTAEPPSGPPAALRKKVTYQLVIAENWASAERRVGPLDPAVAGRRVTLYLISGTHPVTFVAVNPRL